MSALWTTTDVIRWIRMVGLVVVGVVVGIVALSALRDWSPYNRSVEIYKWLEAVWFAILAAFGAIPILIAAYQRLAGKDRSLVSAIADSDGPSTTQTITTRRGKLEPGQLR